MAPAAQRSSSLIRCHSAGPISFDTWIPEAPVVSYMSNLPGKAVDIAWIGVRGEVRSKYQGGAHRAP